MMLKGRESLIRLIGRRRRFLRHRYSLLSSSPPQDMLIIPKDEVSIGNGNGNGSEEMVDCPVCGKQVRADNHVVNSHLDMCLARGTKRKLSQCTLFQFCTRPKVTASLVESDYTRTGVGTSADDGNFNETSSSNGPENNVQRESNSDDECKLLTGAKSKKSGVEDSPQHQISDDRIDNITDSPLSRSENETSKCVEPLEDYDNSKILLDTFIVGRKFGEDTELSTGAMLILSRDSENVKDPNAIKVLTKDTGQRKELGFIPRELAQYLSPLIDNFQLRFEGHVTSTPQHPHAVVPIQIYSSSIAYFGEKDSSSFQEFNSFWRNALCAAEFSKTCPPIPAKYQHNLLLLLKEVLKINAHLFTEDEKTLLEGFLSLSDDSQRLFARLYARKGPWFRMASISYAEICDYEEAVKGLSGRQIL